MTYSHVQEVINDLEPCTLPSPTYSKQRGVDHPFNCFSLVETQQAQQELTHCTPGPWGTQGWSVPAQPLGHSLERLNSCPKYRKLGG